MDNTFIQIPLVETAVEIRFPGNADIDTIRGKFQREIKDSYPSMYVPRISHNDAPALLPYRFANETQTRYVGISLNSLSLVAQNYLGWNTFLSEFMTLWGFLASHISIDTLTRVGVRFQNEFDSYLQEQLKETLPSYLSLLGEDTIAFKNSSEYKTDSGQLVINVDYSSEAQRLIIDYDIFMYNVIPGNLESTLDTLHNQLEAEFIEVIKESFVRKLGIYRS